MLKLYRFPGAYGLESLSPFCVKLEVYLHLAGLDYEAVEFTNPRQAPKGKGPYIEDGAVRLGDKPFFHGAQACTCDATVFAFIEAIAKFAAVGPRRDTVRADQRLMAYCQRMSARVFAA